MPVACSQSVLTGADGLVMFAPAGVNKCLLDYTDFPVGTSLVTLSDHGFATGDTVVFAEEGLATLDTGLTPGTLYTIGLVTPGSSVEIIDQATGAAVILNGDGGLNNVAGGNTASDTPGTANHIRMAMAEAIAVCSVQSWNLSLTKDQVDVSTLPCRTTAPAGGRKVAPVRKQQGTYMNGEGSMEILFTADQNAFGNRLLRDSIMQDSTVRAKLYANAVYSGVGGALSDTDSLYFEGDLNLLGFEVTANTDDALVATVNFSLAAEPVHLFGLDL